MRIRLPDAVALAAAPHLAALALLDAALVVAANAVRAGVPDLDRGPLACDPAEVKAARSVVDTCELLLQLVADLREHALAAERPDPRQLDWPF